MSATGQELRHAAGSAVGWTRAAVGVVDAAVSDGLDHLPAPLSAAGHQARGTLRALVRLPLPTEEVQALLEALHAQRRSIEAMQAQLAAFDHQLQLLEESLRPLETMAERIESLRDSLVEPAP